MLIQNTDTGGGKLVSNGTLLNVTWSIADNSFVSDLKILPLTHFDLIIGMDWLEKHSPMQIHWKSKWLQFQYARSAVKLQEALGPRNRGLSTYEKEYLAILVAIDQ